jgi:hypothetical protein
MSETPTPRPDFNGFWWDLSKSARQAQIEYGRWIVNTLWLMNSGAIAGLLIHWDGKGTVPHKVSIALFTVGIVFGFAAAAAAWLNFTISDDLFRRWGYAGASWASVDVEKNWKWMRRTMYAAIASVLISIGCMVAGAIVALH